MRVFAMKVTARILVVFSSIVASATASAAEEAFGVIARVSPVRTYPPSPVAAAGTRRRAWLAFSAICSIRTQGSGWSPAAFSIGPSRTPAPAPAGVTTDGQCQLLGTIPTVRIYHPHTMAEAGG